MYRTNQDCQAVTLCGGFLLFVNHAIIIQKQIIADNERKGNRMSYNILVAEDEQEIAGILRLYLEK